jgi:alpha-tubulin suppressor-like RCC1 family protein
MNKKICALILALASTAAFAGPEKGAPPKLPPPNLAVDIDAPGAVRAELLIQIPSLKEALRYSLSAQDGSITGGIYIPPGKERLISVNAFDERGERLYAGQGLANIDETLTREIAIRLDGRESSTPLEAKFGTYRLALGFGPNAADGFLIEATLFDALGNHLPFKPDDVKWGFPGDFVPLPYSCFQLSLCIDLPDPKRFAEVIACYYDFSCWNKPPKDDRGPYRYVAVGLNHTCALTITNEVRCWGDNALGQLGAPTGFCQFSSHNCSLVPVPVVCPTGASCKFISLAAGGNHTCAIDTNAKAWCWGDDGNLATGVATSNFGLGLPEHRQVPALNVSFVTIDTNMDHTCALSSGLEVYCWGSNTRGQLGYPQSVNNGTAIATKLANGKQYQDVKVGSLHTCAILASNAWMDCFGENFDYQVTGTLTFGFGASATVNPLIQLLQNKSVNMQATGATDTCAENWNDDIICWGSPANGGLTSNGFLALHNAFATSIATDIDLNGAAPGLGTHTCVTGRGGSLFCGQWTYSIPPQLAAVPDPQSNHVVVWQEVDVGPNHVCGVTTMQEVWCFGLNSFGQFGTGVRATTRVDVPVTAANR